MTPLEETQQALRELIAHVTSALGLQRMSLDTKMQQICLRAHYILTLYQSTVNTNSRVQIQRTYALNLTHEEAQALLSRLSRRELAGGPLVPIYDDLSRAVYPTAGAQSTGIHVDPDA
jgi:hypothetical protein